VPWSKELITTDAFRAPLERVFHIVEAIQNYHNSARWVEKTSYLKRHKFSIVHIS